MLGTLGLRKLKGWRMNSCEQQEGTVLIDSRDLSPSGHLVYLDLNKWIDLARAELGQEKGKRHRVALDEAERLVGEGRATFPLSFAHFMEAAKNWR
jgi:hypothetical protein